MFQNALSIIGDEEGYARCWTGEPFRRPIPFVSTDDKPKRLAEIFRRNIKPILKRIMRDFAPVVQPINRISKLGWPVNRNPPTKDELNANPTAAQKIDYVQHFFREIHSGNLNSFAGACTLLSGRLQYEPPGKKREYLFIKSDGQIYTDEFNASDRVIDVPDLGERIGSRYRLVFNPPITNLYCQCFDSALHRCIMRHALCFANMYTGQAWSSETHWHSFDCSHYERVLGTLAPIYASAVGGLYEQLVTWMIGLPLIVQSDDRKKVFKITPRFREGVYPQFGSGLCCVATLGKLAGISAETEYFERTLGISTEDAIEVTLSGQGLGMTRMMYGDDNCVAGPTDQVENYFSFLETVFDISRDEHPTYLGFAWNKQVGRFQLGADKYVLKMYLRERSFDWTDYPYFAWVERRKIFAKHGHPDIIEKVIPQEDADLLAFDLPWAQVVHKAAEEAAYIRERGDALSKQLTDKEYLLSPEEYISLGLAWGIPVSETTQIIDNLISPETRKYYS